MNQRLEQALTDRGMSSGRFITLVREWLASRPKPADVTQFSERLQTAKPTVYREVCDDLMKVAARK